MNLILTVQEIHCCLQVVLILDLVGKRNRTRQTVSWNTSRPGSISLPVEFHLDTPHSRPCLTYMCFSEWLCCTKLVNMLCPSPQASLPVLMYTHPVRLLVSARLIQPANSVFLLQQTSISQPKPVQKPTSEHADYHIQSSVNCLFAMWCVPVHIYNKILSLVRLLML